MKFWVKIIIAVCIVLVLGFAVWAFFIKEKDEVQAYNKTAELIDYKESLGIEEKLLDLSTMNYYNGDSSKIIDNSTDIGKEIYRLRNICLSSEKITGYGDGDVAYIYDSYLVTDNMIDDILEYLLPYTKSDKVNGKSLSSLKDKINKYIDKLKDLNSNVEELIKFQNYIQGEENDFVGLKGRYNTFYYKYRETLNASANLIISLLEYLDVSVYSDNIIIDTSSALFDAFARALQVSTSVQPILENDYAHDLHIVMTRIREFNNGTTIFTEKYSEYDFLSSYNKLFNKHRDVLNEVFNCKHLKKKQMAENINNSLSEIAESAQTPVINILNVLGYGV
ncbi:MAG: hypothetical protein ACI4PF_06020 [Christensenellales bacterium]